jgi:asparagine synthase (glutamine-hydrolysing)
MLDRLRPGALRKRFSHHLDPDPRELSQRVRDDHLTYLSEARFANLEACVDTVNRDGVAGDFHEAGIALGGSAIFLASLMGEGRRFHGYDVFEQIPAPSERDGRDAHDRYAAIAEGGSEGIGGDAYYGYVPDLYQEVVGSFRRYGVPVDGEHIALHRGRLEDTLAPDRPVALAHIDCDWHDPVSTCLERFYPRLAAGGYLVLDDYNDWSGCRTATDAFLASHGDLEIVTMEDNLVIRRASG